MVRVRKRAGRPTWTMSIATEQPQTVLLRPKPHQQQRSGLLPVHPVLLCGLPAVRSCWCAGVPACAPPTSRTPWHPTATTATRRTRPLRLTRPPCPQPASDVARAARNTRARGSPHVRGMLRILAGAGSRSTKARPKPRGRPLRSSSSSTFQTRTRPGSTLLVFLWNGGMGGGRQAGGGRECYLPICRHACVGVPSSPS